jgi:hypothetical protein
MEVGQKTLRHLRDPFVHGAVIVSQFSVDLMAGHYAHVRTTAM